MITETREILERMIDITGSGTEYLELSGSDHKTWLIPRKHLRQGLKIYQPCSIKGRLVKRLIPFCAGMSPLLARLHIERSQFQIKVHIEEILRDVLGGYDENFIYSIYIGDSCFVENRKAIIQISLKKQILAYAKITQEAETAKLFRREVDHLTWLRHKGIQSVPRILWAGEMEKQYCFIQSTEKNGRERNIKCLTPNHWKFLQEMDEKTSVEMDFMATEYAEELRDFYLFLKKGTWKSKELLCDCICFIESYYFGKKIHTSFFHGDFTPWNICCKRNHLFVFDFEYSRRCFPAWLDPFHFITQVGIMTERLSEEEIYQKFNRQEKIFQNYMENPRLNYMCYLVYEIWFYYKRWRSDLFEDEHSCKIWIRMLQLCYRDLRGE